MIEDTGPRIKDPLNRSKRRIVVDSTQKFPAGYSSVGFTLNGQIALKNKSKNRLLTGIEPMDTTKLDALTDGYLNASIGAKSPFRLLKDIE